VVEVSDLELFPVDAPARPKLTGDARRVERQAEAMAARQHPLVAALRIPLALHVDAAPAGDRTAPGLRCGTCVHRQTPYRRVAGRYPKCAHGGRWERATGGPGTDVRAWWPACVNHKGDAA
jgi:hypothetical protein